LGSDAKERVIAGQKRQLVVLKMKSEELVKSMADLGESAIQALVAKTVEVQVTTINLSMFAIFEFQGFDPDAIIRKLLVLKNHYGFSDDDLKQDIMYMIAANIYMGNLSGKAMGRRSQDGRDMIDDLVSRYQVKVGTTSTGLASDIITFPRVAGTFPVLSCRMATKLPTKDMVGQPFMSVPVPRFMRMGAFASFCGPTMRERTRVFLLKAVAAYSCDQSIVFELGRLKKLKKKGDELKIDAALIGAEQWPFIWVASESKVPDLEMRKKAIVEFNVSGLYGTLKPVIENYNIIMKDTTGIPTKEEYESDLSDFVSGS